MTLSFGYNQGLPDEATIAWGGRFIVTQDGHVDLPWDRTDCIGPDGDRQKFLELVNQRYPMPTMREAISEGLCSRRIRTREADEVVLYEDDDLKVLGNSNASAGYFYITAYRKDRT